MLLLITKTGAHSVQLCKVVDCPVQQTTEISQLQSIDAVVVVVVQVLQFGCTP